ncbi:MAG: hypothetical protein RH917_09975 [Lacipirellulaceae bacterium]
MARQTHKREDLLRDAVALSPRIKLLCEDAPDVPIFAGFRGEALSLYFDEDPAYHFNGEKELRRAFFQDALYECANGQLRKLIRDTSSGAVKLQRLEVSAEFQSDFSNELQSRLSNLNSSITAATFKVEGQVPEDGEALNKLRFWLESFNEVVFANSARVR